LKVAYRELFEAALFRGKWVKTETNLLL